MALTNYVVDLTAARELLSLGEDAAPICLITDIRCNDAYSALLSVWRS
jgi:hypothetical protein